MAARRRGLLASTKTMLALLGLVAIPVLYGVVTGWNPLPAWKARVAALVGPHLGGTHTLSDPAAAWTVRLGDTPTWAAGAGTVVIVGTRDTVEARHAATGALIWSQPVDWATVAGPDGGTVVLTGARGHGLTARDPAAGTTRWTDPAAIAVWGYRDMAVSIACADLLSCTVTARVPATGTVLWRSPLGGNARPLSGAGKGLAAMRPLGTVPAVAPAPAPPLLGFPVDDNLQVIDSTDGRRLHSYRNTQSSQAVVAGDRVLVTTIKLRDGHCRFAVAARDPVSDAQVWQRDGYDLHTSTGECAQREPPQGADGVVYATGPDNADVLLDLGSGAELWRAPGEQSVVSLGEGVAVVRDADGTHASAVPVPGGGRLWQREVTRATRPVLVPGAVVLSDAGGGTLTALDPDSGRVRLAVRSSASVLGYTGSGLMLAIGRTIGLLALPGA